MSAVLEKALARCARAMADVLISFAAEVEQGIGLVSRPEQGARTKRAADEAPGASPASPLPARQADASGPPPAVARRGGGFKSKIDPGEFAEAWKTRTLDEMAARFAISRSYVNVFKRKLGLPAKRTGRPRKETNPARNEPVRATWAAPIVDAPGSRAPAPSGPGPDSKNAIPGLRAAPFDETGPVSIDTVIKFLRQRDTTVVVRPEGGFELDGRRKVDRAGLLSVANRKRALMGKPEFVLDGEALRPPAGPSNQLGAGGGRRAETT
jgi:hypothetical protein